MHKLQENAWPSASRFNGAAFLGALIDLNLSGTGGRLTKHVPIMRKQSR